MYFLRKLFIINLLFIVLSTYEKEITKNILQINIDLSKFLIIINIVSIFSTIVLSSIWLTEYNYDDKRKNIEIQLYYFYHLCDSIIYSIEKES